MINRVEDQALVLRVGCEVRRVEKPIDNRQSGLPIAPAVVLVASGREVIAEADQPLRGDSCSRAVNRLALVEGIGGLAQVIAEPMEIWRARVPHRNSIGAGVGKQEIRRRSSGE